MSYPVPVPGGSRLAGHVRELRTQPLQFLLGAQSELGDKFAFRLGPIVNYVFAGAEDVKFIVQEGHGSFSKNPRVKKVLSRAMGFGLVTNDGETHLRQRRMIQPGFRTERVAAYADGMIQVAEDLALKWKSVADKNGTINISADMSALARNVMMRAMLGETSSPVAHDVAEAIEELNQQLNDDILVPWHPPKWFPTLRNRRFNKSLAVIDRWVFDSLSTPDGRRAQGDGYLIALLESARDAHSGLGMSPEAIRDEALTLFVAGHETVANALAWTWYLLGTHPEEAQALREEIERVVVAPRVRIEDLDRLVVLNQVVLESLRLYPPIALFDRVALRSVEIGGVPIPKGGVVYVSPYLTHRSPVYWKVPDKFHLSHFDGEAVKKRHPYAYFPFGGGPRQCIGKAFGLFELQLVVATLVRKFVATVASQEVPVPRLGITLRPPPISMRISHVAGR